MPKLGMTMEEGKLVEWLNAEKDEVNKGDLLYVIESDKVTFEVESPGSGLLVILKTDGEGIPVGTLLGYVAESVEEYATLLDGGAPDAGAPTRESGAAPVPAEVKAAVPAAETAVPGKVRATPAARAAARKHHLDLTAITGSGPKGRISRADVEQAATQAAPAPAGGKVLASPGARKQAREMGIDLAQVTGTGPNGRVTRKDVLDWKPTAAAAAPAEVEAAMVNGKYLLKEAPMSTIRATISRRMMESLQNAAQMTAFSEWDVTELMKLRKSLNDQGDVKISFPGLMVFFLGRVLKEMPIFNALFNGKNIQYWRDANVGVAVSVDDTLVVPVVRAADKQSLADIQTDLGGLIERARSKSLLPDDMSGGTFTLSNVGSYASEWETVILNPPEVALLGIGAIVKKAVVIDDEIVVRQMMPISLTFDHRVIDGATAGAFRNRMKALIENPGMLITCF